MLTPNRLNRLDGMWVITLLLLTTLYIVRCFNFSCAPFEDAAMNMRYAKHLAEGHGIVWNIGEKPVDGATDFLFIVLVALFIKSGLSLEISVRLIGFLSHFLL